VPDLCSVTYSGTCLPLETFPQEEWGNAGGEPANTVPGNLTDLQVISTLLGQGPLVVGGTHRSLTLTDAQCLVNLVPGVGNPSVLGNCHQTNCANGCNPAGPIGMKNTLATNAIALTLNIRYNIEYNGLNFNAIRAQSLDCVTLDPNIVHCEANGNCKLRVFESNGTAHEFPYTIGGLLDMANYFLDGGWGFTDGAYYTYGAGLNKSISNVNAYWHGGGLAGSSCNPAAGVSSPVVVDKPLPGIAQPKADKVAFSLAPNPASSEVSFKLTGLAESQDVVFEVYNPLGQLVLSRSFRSVASINERINIGSLGSGLYLVSVKAGNERYEQKLLVAKN
jgi:hypothetical protein